MTKQLEELVTVYHGCDFALLVRSIANGSILSSNRILADTFGIEKVGSPYFLHEDMIIKMGSRGFKRYWTNIAIDVHNYVKRHKEWLLEHGNEETQFLLKNWKGFRRFVPNTVKGTKFFKRNCIWASKSEQDARYLGSHGYFELRVPEKNIYFGAVENWGIVPGQLSLKYASKLKVFDYEYQGALEMHLVISGLDKIKVELIS